MLVYNNGTTHVVLSLTCSLGPRLPFFSALCSRRPESVPSLFPPPCPLHSLHHPSSEYHLSPPLISRPSIVDPSQHILHAQCPATPQPLAHAVSPMAVQPKILPHLHLDLHIASVAGPDLPQRKSSHPRQTPVVHHHAHPERLRFHAW
jgi:hypothetical protein